MTESQATLRQRRPRARNAWLAMALREAWWQIRLFWRVPPAAVFTFVLPVALLLLLYWRRAGDVAFADIGFSQAVIPGIAALGVVVACYVNTAIEVAFARDKEILKRLRGTPLPPSAYIAARIVSAAGMGTLSALVMILVGVIFFDIQLGWLTVPTVTVALLVGAGCFCALGLAVASVIPSGEAAPAITNFTLFPLIFFSGMVAPVEDSPRWLTTLASLFPLRPFAEAMRMSFDSTPPDWGLWASNLALILVWAAVGVLLALRFFSWLPREPRSDKVR